TIVSLADGSASVYTTGTFGIIGGIGHETVRTAAKKVVKDADRYFDDSTPTQDFSYPSPGHVRFFFTTFSGVRVIDTEWASLSGRRSKYFALFDAAQDVLTQLSMVTETRCGLTKRCSEPLTGPENPFSMTKTLLSEANS